MDLLRNNKYHFKKVSKILSTFTYILDYIIDNLLKFSQNYLIRDYSKFSCEIYV